MEKVLVIGASENPERYSNIATKMLNEYRHHVIAYGQRLGDIDTIPIFTTWDFKEGDFDTVTLYVGPQHQPAFYDKIVTLNPRRVIFNPGTENEEFQNLLKEKGIIAEEACTLVLLRTNQF